MQTKYPFLAVETYADYAAQRSNNLSSHALADFRKSPILYRRKKDGLIPAKDRPSYAIGRAAHTLILEGRDAFHAAYAVGGPVNQKTGKEYGSETKAFAEFAATAGKPVISTDDSMLLSYMLMSVKAHDQAREILSEGQAEGVCRSTYGGQRSQIRIDWFSKIFGIVDLKTCQDLDYFDADARMYGYGHQMAFYRSVLARDTNITEKPPCWLIAVEKSEPFRVGCWQISEEYLDHCRVENDASISRLNGCEKAGTWPTNYEDIRVL